jgi:hypothetical protein
VPDQHEIARPNICFRVQPDAGGFDNDAVAMHTHMLLLMSKSSCLQFATSFAFQFSWFLVTSKNLLLVLDLISIPQQSRLSIQRGRTNQTGISEYIQSRSNSVMHTYSALPADSVYSTTHFPYSAPRSTHPPSLAQLASEYPDISVRSCRRWGGRLES